MHPRLTGCALKNQEELFLYNYRNDERYELDNESFEFLKHCTGGKTLQEILETTGASSSEAVSLLDYLVSEECVEDQQAPDGLSYFNLPEPVFPSLRYLQLHITERCNMDCIHCYLGEKEQKDMDINLIEKALREFSPNGLKVLITGGEALLHKRFWEVIEMASSHPVRLELLSNGTLITEDVAKKLAEHVHSVQISLDGLEKGHEYLRGKGSFKKTLRGIKNAARHLDINIATMVHKANINEFSGLEKLVLELGPIEWSVDVPSLAGNATKGILPTLEEAAKIFRAHGFGSGVHEGDIEYSCGSHICTVDVNGNVSKCGLFKEGVANLKDQDLNELWKRVVDRYTPPVTSLKCGDCMFLDTCRGGCRYRALVSGDFLGKDSFMCEVHLRS